MKLILKLLTAATALAALVIALVALEKAAAPKYIEVYSDKDELY